jgi:hypothetical protein
VGVEVTVLATEVDVAVDSGVLVGGATVTTGVAVSVSVGGTAVAVSVAVASVAEGSGVFVAVASSGVVLAVADGVNVCPVDAVSVATGLSVASGVAEDVASAVLVAVLVRLVTLFGVPLPLSVVLRRSFLKRRASSSRHSSRREVGRLATARSSLDVIWTTGSPEGPGTTACGWVITSPVVPGLFPSRSALGGSGAWLGRRRRARSSSTLACGGSLCVLCSSSAVALDASAGGGGESAWPT